MVVLLRVSPRRRLAQRWFPRRVVGQESPRPPAGQSRRAPAGLLVGASAESAGGRGNRRGPGASRVLPSSTRTSGSLPSPCPGAGKAAGGPTGGGGVRNPSRFAFSRFEPNGDAAGQTATTALLKCPAVARVLRIKTQVLRMMAAGRTILHPLVCNGG